jgi:hypothetical protein
MTVYVITLWAGRWATYPYGDPDDITDHDSLEEALATLRDRLGVVDA